MIEAARRLFDECVEECLRLRRKSGELYEKSAEVFVESMMLEHQMLKRISATLMDIYQALRRRGDYERVLGLMRELDAVESELAELFRKPFRAFREPANVLELAKSFESFWKYQALARRVFTEFSRAEKLLKRR
ncbi:MAG TPA: hypothetical protein ENF26_03045 [Methanomicrobia archaeon]|nr:hypothetical protein [Methanomicrobia archaeon]HEX59109.1 hypothetical protein [Methanomicrobia archaeon]